MLDTLLQSRCFYDFRREIPPESNGSNLEPPSSNSKESRCWILLISATQAQFDELFASQWTRSQLRSSASIQTLNFQSKFNQNFEVLFWPEQELHSKKICENK